MNKENNFEMNKVGLIKSHLFENISFLGTIGTKKRNYVGRETKKKVDSDLETLTYLDVKKENEIDKERCFIKKNLVKLPEDYKGPITAGLDTSYGTQNFIVRGNACYGWGAVLVSSIEGEVSEEIISAISKLSRYAVMVSNKVFEDPKKTGVLVDHAQLQENMFNMLKVVAEGKMISDPLKKLVDILTSYNYRYDLSGERVIVFKDGPLASGFFEPFGNALLTNKFPDRLEDEHEIYKTVSLAGIRGIPIVGITKHPSYSVIGKHFGEEDVLDYSIVKQIAEGDNYFYIGPFERKHKKNPSFKIHYYYLYLEERFSPLRLEIIPNLLPSSLKSEDLIEDIMRSMMSTDNGEISNNGEDYKLPLSISLVDQITREEAKKKSAELYEAMLEVCRKIPGSILDRRR